GQQYESGRQRSDCGAAGVDERQDAGGFDVRGEPAPQRRADQRKKDARYERDREHERQAQAQDRLGLRNRRQPERRDDRWERRVRRHGRHGRGKRDRRRKAMRPWDHAHPERRGETTERDAGKDDAEHHREGVGVPLDEEEEEAEPDDFEREQAESGSEGCRQPPESAGSTMRWRRVRKDPAYIRPGDTRPTYGLRGYVGRVPPSTPYPGRLPPSTGLLRGAPAERQSGPAGQHSRHRRREQIQCAG